MPVPAAVSLSSLHGLERRLPRLRQLNLLLLVGLALLTAGLSWDAARSIAEVRRPVEPALPNLSDLKGALPAIPAVTLPEGLFVFQAPAAAEPKPPAVTVAEGAGWRLKGVLVGAVKRAMLEDTQKPGGVWVTEGQQVGPWKVLRIEERSVLLEKEGVTHEIRM